MFKFFFSFIVLKNIFVSVTIEKQGQTAKNRVVDRNRERYADKQINNAKTNITDRRRKKIQGSRIGIGPFIASLN